MSKIIGAKRYSTSSAKLLCDNASPGCRVASYLYKTASHAYFVVRQVRVGAGTQASLESMTVDEALKLYERCKNHACTKDEAFPEGEEGVIKNA
jgi:hypothetical protein